MKSLQPGKFSYGEDSILLWMYYYLQEFEPISYQLYVTTVNELKTATRPGYDNSGWLVR